jgi:peroxiredoxin (alkyl hydroperoxide reductase subunit C)
MTAFQENLSKLESADTQVVGVSVDSPFANKAWADQMGAKFPIASDFFNNNATIKEYGLYDEKNHVSRRATFLIGKDGKIEEMSVDREAVDPTKIVTACERKKHAGS